MTETAVSVLPPGSGGRVLDFRRRGTPPRRKKKSLLWVLGKPLAVAFGLVALPTGVVAWVLKAPRFGLRNVEVMAGMEMPGTPAHRVSEEWVRRALAPLEGKNLVRLSLAEAAARVERNPWIESVEMAKELPGRLRVKVAERRPVALLLADGGLVYADSEGRAIAPVRTPAELEEARKEKLLVVSFSQRPHGEGISTALAVAAELGRVQPTWAGKLSRIEVLGEGDFRLHTEALPFPLLVTRGQVRPKIERLVELLPELSRRYPKIEAVDLRFSRRIVVQPALLTPPPGGTGA
ncbi:MAG TPA: FtsQ-type POTRA domain-containing protein [Thermoanaerobaculia bacterium]|jgi:cell division septal protein FtsQ|nr:FtsQ-type POTRA domain-containing protein [Thermoanaerobaculia bacterium]